MTDKIEKLANDEIGIIVWPYGAGRKQVGLCFGGKDEPEAIFELSAEQAFQLQTVIFGEDLRAEVAALRQQLDEARGATKSVIDEALALAEAQLRVIDQRDAAEADRDRLLVVYRAAEAWRDGWGTDWTKALTPEGRNTESKILALINAVDAYRAGGPGGER